MQSIFSILLLTQFGHFSSSISSTSLISFSSNLLNLFLEGVFFPSILFSDFVLELGTIFFLLIGVWLIAIPAFVPSIFKVFISF